MEQSETLLRPQAFSGNDLTPTDNDDDVPDTIPQPSDAQDDDDDENFANVRNVACESI